MTRQRGFTLIEMAIVLVIITILIGGLAVPLSAQIQARRISETNKTLEEAREAIIGYAMTHQVMVDHDFNPATPDIARPYLPCPDSDAVPDGIENRDAATKLCTQDVGLFPWVTLGTASQDAWGNRLRYASKPELTRADTGFSSTTAPAGWYEVCSAHACASPDVAADVPVVLVSHGANGWGAHNINGNTLAAPTGANEQENLDADNRYVSRAPSKPDDASGEFDDLTTWLSFNVIVTRVCPAGGCP
jgi:prepilin-type N-terminal cleavage/methylation domain-containing protein